MNERIKRSWKKAASYLLGAGILASTVLGIRTFSFAAEENAYNETVDDIQVELSTDKTDYLAGEDIQFQLKITNNRAYWDIFGIDVSYSCTDGLYTTGDTELSDSIGKIVSGESYELTGTMAGTEDAFPASGNPSGLKSGSSSGSGLLIGIILGVVVIAIAGILVLRKKGKGGIDGKGGKANLILMILLAGGSMVFGVSHTMKEVSAAPETTTIRPYVKVQYAGKEAMIRMVLNMEMVQQKATIPEGHGITVYQVSCHDPSIFKDFDGTYYVFGTHMGLASSEDLLHWTAMEKDFRASFTEETKEKIRAYNKDSSSGDWFGYLWAPDVIYNEKLGKYCMYLSANGDDWVSNIVLLTADEVTGPYEYVDSVVYGGFTQNTLSETDVPKVLGTTTIPERYVKNGVENKKWGDKFPNCIDPCVFYDDEGKLWMSYGSWSGGIFLLALDDETGLRDYSVTYETNETSDEYFGKKIAGGWYVSGEGSYIQKVGDYYYLFISYGNLEAAGGYNVRVYRSETPDGDYVDEKGNSALYGSYVFNYNQSNGIRLFGGYKWRYFSTGQVAQGHNSAFVDDDGRAYIIFHTRTTNGSEGHFIKVHQLFVNEDGWLVAAPYQTNGEVLNEQGLTVDEMVGTYDFIRHDLEIDYKNLGVNTPVQISLNEDMTISGALEGTWELEAGTPYIHLMIDGEIYKGVALIQKVEGSDIDTPVFTALGEDNQLTVWGSKAFE